MAECRNHPSIPAASACAKCAASYCDHCLVDFLGQPHCGPCRDRRLAEMQGPPRVVYTPGRRVRGGLLAALLTLLVFIGPLVAALVVMHFAAPGGRGPLSALLALGGLALGVAAIALLAPRIALLGNQGLLRDIRARVALSGAPGAVQHGLFVGISPGRARQSFDLESHWDVGFLMIEPGLLVYYGDRTWFGLRPDQVLGLEVDRGWMFNEDRLLVHWREPLDRAAGVLALSVRQVMKWREIRTRVEELRDRLQRWKDEPIRGDSSAAQIPLPPASAAGGEELPRSAQYAGRPLRLLLFTLFVSMGAVLGWLKVDIRLASVIVTLIVLAGVLSQAWERRRKQ